MKDFNKRFLILIILLASSFLLIACKGEKIIISSTANKTIAGETVAIIPKINTDKEYSISWFEKKDDADWLDLENENEILYVIDNYGGKYSYKAVLTTEGKVYESNVVDIEMVDMTGATLGHSPIGLLATANIDYSYDTGEAGSKIIHQPANSVLHQYAYFKEVYGIRYAVSVDVDLVSINGSEPYPKSGILAARLNDNMIYFAFDARPTYDFGDLVIVNHTPSDGGTWKWPGIVYNIPGLRFRDGIGNRIKNKLTVVRNVEDFYFLINDKFLTHINYPGLSQPTLAGTYTMGQNTEFSNYFAYVDDPNDTNDQYDSVLKSVLDLMG